MSSPFSIETYKWEIDYNVIPSTPRILRTEFSKQEVRALNAVKHLGIIGSAQFRNLFFPKNKAHIHHMLRQHKIIEHPIKRRDGNKMTTLQVYTLGYKSLEYFHILDYMNYWLEYNSSEVLQRLAFFKLYQRFVSKEPVVYRAPPPFTGMFDISGDPIDVLVVKNNTQEIQNEWRFIKPNPNKRMIVLTENLNWLKPINEFLIPCKVRVALESDLDVPIEQMFYHWDSEKNMWSK